MTATNETPVIGYCIAIGNPSEGFSLYGFFQSQQKAIEAAENDRTTGPDWWVMPIYKQEA